MKIDVSTLVLAAPVTWLACAYAYMLGVLLPYGLDNLALLGIDDVLATATPRLAPAMTLLGAILAVVLWLIPVGAPWSKRAVGRMSRAFLIGLVVVLLMIEIGASSGTLDIPVNVRAMVLPVATGLIAALGIVHDDQSKGARGRIAAGLLAAVLLAYQMGVHARLERPGERPVRVVLTDGAVQCGDLLLASPAGLFTVESGKILNFIQASAYRSLSHRKCQPQEHAVTSSPLEPR